MPCRYGTEGVARFDRVGSRGCRCRLCSRRWSRCRFRCGTRRSTQNELLAREDDRGQGEIVGRKDTRKADAVACCNCAERVSGSDCVGALRRRRSGLLLLARRCPGGRGAGELDLLARVDDRAHGHAVEVENITHRQVVPGRDGADGVAGPDGVALGSDHGGDSKRRDLGRDEGGGDDGVEGDRGRRAEGPHHRRRLNLDSRGRLGKGDRGKEDGGDGSRGHSEAEASGRSAHSVGRRESGRRCRGSLGSHVLFLIWRRYGNRAWCGRPG